MLGAIGLTTFTGAINLSYLRGSMVSRQEIDAKIAEVNASILRVSTEANTKNLALEKDLTALKLALAERGIKERTASER